LNRFHSNILPLHRTYPTQWKCSCLSWKKMLNFIVAVMLANITMVYGTYL
jgi:hypothetical protein